MSTPKRRPAALSRGSSSRGAGGRAGGTGTGRAKGSGGSASAPRGSSGNPKSAGSSSGGRTRAGTAGGGSGRPKGSVRATGSGRGTGVGRAASPVRGAGIGRGSGTGSGRVRGSSELGGDQVEGRQAVRELLRAGRRPVHQLLIAEGLDAVDDDHPMAEILSLAEHQGIPVRRVPRGRIDAEAGTEAPQGVLARAEPVVPVELDRLTRAADDGTPPFLVVLDGVTDPHNLGAVMRTALSAGATGLVIGRHRAAHLSPSAVKAAAGAVEHLPVSVVTGIPAALGELVSAGVWTIGLDADSVTPVWDLGVATAAVAIVLGAEGRGLSRLAQQRCDLTVAIPLLGPLDSLNVSAAAAVACFEVARRRGDLAVRERVPRSAAP